MSEQQRIQLNDSHQKPHSGFYLQNLKTILLYFQLISIPCSLTGHRKYCAFFLKIDYKEKQEKESNSELGGF